MVVKMTKTSTPLHTPHNNLRKSVLLKDAINTSPSLRRLSDVIQTPINQVIIDDEGERSRRRSEAELHNRVSNIGVQSPTPVNEKEIRDHFQTCIKMYAENKICSKNAWNLNIIDYMRTMFSKKGQTRDSLQVAGTSLDVSTKIYGIRVDDIHSEGFKLASNMARVNANEGDGQDEENIDDEETRKGPKKKRVKTGPKLTVAKDHNSLVGDVPKMESIFFQARMNLDASSTDNSFTIKIPMHLTGHKFMLLSKENSWISHDNPITMDPMNKYSLELTKLKNICICPQFNNFEIDEWDPENEKEILGVNGTVAEEVVFDEDGIPIPELDGSVHDLFAAAQSDNYASDEEVVNEIGHIQKHRMSHILDFNPDDNEICADEYNYSNAIKLMGNKHLTQLWAGPSHWKLKYIKPTASRFSGQLEKQFQKTTRKRKGVTDALDLIEYKSNLNKNKILKVKRKAVCNFYNCTLPLVFCNISATRTPLQLKMVYLNTINGSGQIDKEVNTYNYENPNDSQYCVENGLDDDDNRNTDEGEDIIHEEGGPMALQQNGFDENLVDIPELVEKAYIPYAVLAKKMDMKKLKNCIWKSLISEQNEKIPDDGMYNRAVIPKTFSEMYKNLPYRISDKMQQELSCPLAFVALLHLANEQNLHFEKMLEFTDFKIKQQKTVSL